MTEGTAAATTSRWRMHSVHDGHASTLLWIVPPGQPVAGIEERFRAHHAVITYHGVLPTSSEVHRLAAQCVEELETIGIKKISLVGYGPGCPLAIGIALCAERMLRRLVLVDPLSRVAPGIGARCVDWIERFLPVGLPLRAASGAFDARPFLHRVRCPAMVLSTAQASPFVQAESRYIAAKIPNCYHAEVNVCMEATGAITQEAHSLIEQFLLCAVKRPQRGR